MRNQSFKLLIDGELRDAAGSMEVINPATEAVIALAPRADAGDMEQAIAAAKRAFPAWSRTPLAERRAVLRAMAQAISAEADDLAALLTTEQGKPLPFAMAEVQDLCGFLEFYANTPLEPAIIEDSETRRVTMVRKPLGVVAGIVPWNFPVGLIGAKLPPALLMGNTFVLKPAGTTPLTALRIGEILRDIVPPGVFNVVSDANDLGDLLTGHPDVRKVSFTGSTATGRKVMASAAQGVKRVTLELGGNDAAIVLDDVDPKAVAPGLFAGAFFNSGQVCIAIKRLYVHDAVYDEVCQELAGLAEQAVVGNGVEPGVIYGPLQNRAQFDRVSELIEEAGRDGTLVAGGLPESGTGYFIKPTIVRDVSDGHRLVDEEQFGPVLPVIRFTDVDDAVARANASAFGLGGSVWSADSDRARAIAEQFETGAVWINKHMDVAPHIPFAGAKASGVGVEFGAAALAEFSQLQIVNEGPNKIAGE